MDNNIIFWIFGGIIISVYFIAGIYYLNRYKKEKKYTSKTHGKIIDSIRKTERYYDVDGNSTTKRYWYFLCEYYVNGEKCVRQTNIGTFTHKYKIGQVVTIYYNPDNCHEAYIEGDNNTKEKIIVLFVLGIMGIAFLFLFSKFI